MVLYPPRKDLLLTPVQSKGRRAFFLARHAPLEPSYAKRTFPGDGGYPAYYHRIWAVLNELGYDVRTSCDPYALLGARGWADIAFSLYNRIPIGNPEIFIPSFCDFLGIPCIGAAPNIRALAEDKWLSKLAAKASGIPVSPGAVYESIDSLVNPPPFKGPYFIKNRFGAASEGITAQSIQDDWAGASRIAKDLMSQGMSVLVEAYVEGVDVTLPVLGGSNPMLLGYVRPRSDKQGAIFTEDLKRDDPLGYELFDPKEQSILFQQDVVALWQAAGPMDYLRLDYRFNPDTGERAFLEFNICCHIGRSGAICLAAKQWDIGQVDMLGHIVEACYRRQAKVRERAPWAS